MPQQQPQRKKRDDEEILSEARTRFALCEEAEREIRDEALKDQKFLAGDQWDAEDIRRRKAGERPFLTFNKLAPMVQSVSNQVRQNKPAIKVHPESGEARKETAEVLQGLIRHIEYASQADVAYDCAVECSAGCGFGYYRITTEFADEEGFEQEIRIERVLDPFSIYMDPHAQRADKSDAMYAFEMDPVSREQHLREYPDSEVSNFQGGSETAPDWITSDSVLRVKYWRVELEKRTRHQYADGSTGWADEPGPYDETTGGPVQVVATRQVEQRQVRCYTINGIEILEEADWAGKWIPLIPIWGKETIVDGKRKLFSLIRFARDAQQLYNYYKTSIAETLSLASKAPWIGYEGQFKDPRWKNANTVNYAYLEVPRETIGGQPVPLPQRNTFEAPIASLSAGAMQEADDIKSTIGIFDPSLGGEAREKSGVAIARRQAQSNVVNFHFPDNLTRAQVFGGRVLIDLVPKIYDTPRMVRIIGEDEKAKVVLVNEPHINEEGKPVSYMLDAGKYGVTVTTGPSYTTQREEAFDMLSQMAGANPKIMDLGGDLIFQNSDIPGGDQLAERWKKMLPAQLQDDQANQQQIPPQVQQQLQMLSQELQAAHAFGQELMGQVKTKKLELDSRERIAALQAQVELIKTEAQLNAQNAQALLRAELQAIEQKLSMLTAPPAMMPEQPEQPEMMPDQADQAEQPQPAAEPDIPLAA